MNFAKITAAAAALALTSVAAQAQEAAPAVELSTGATVTGNDGNAIGTIAEVSEAAVLVDTGTYKIALPGNAFGAGDAGPTLNITKTALEEAYAAQLAQAEQALAAALVVGANVQTADPQPLGTIDTIDGENVVLVRTDESKVTLPKDMFAVDGEGNLIARITMAQLEEALAAQQG